MIFDIKHRLRMLITHILCAQYIIIIVLNSVSKRVRDRTVDKACASIILGEIEM